jgi:hypothetical protein
MTRINKTEMPTAKGTFQALTRRNRDRPHRYGAKRGAR